MDQLNLFAPVETAPAAYRPEPARVRARLERILGDGRALQAEPWSRDQLLLYRTVVPQLAGWLPEAEAAGWRARFEAELARLGVPA